MTKGELVKAISGAADFIAACDIADNAYDQSIITQESCDDLKTVIGSHFDSRGGDGLSESGYKARLFDNIQLTK
jgi:predicted GTPase